VTGTFNIFETIQFALASSAISLNLSFAKRCRKSKCETGYCQLTLESMGEMPKAKTDPAGNIPQDFFERKSGTKFINIWKDVANDWN
jgi:hypothetical protein